MRPIVKSIIASIAPAAIAASALVAATQTGFAQSQPAPAAQSAPAGQTAPAGPQEQLKQIPLTDQQIQHFLAAKKDIDAILDALPDAASGQPDAAALAKIDTIAKKNGFASGAEYDQVSGNIELVMAGIDPQTKKYLGADGMIKQQIAQVQVDKALKPKDRSDMLAQLGEDLKETTPVQNPGNIALVTKYYDKLNAAISQD